MIYHANGACMARPQRFALKDFAMDNPGVEKDICLSYENAPDLSPELAAMRLNFTGPKLHGIQVTESALNYHGSITIDADILEASGLLPLEFVNIWNKASGARISTYVLPGTRNTGVVCLNGAAARSCQVGDEVIITAERSLGSEALPHGPAAKGTDATPFCYSTRVLVFSHEQRVNSIAQILRYSLERLASGQMRFTLTPVEAAR